MSTTDKTDSLIEFFQKIEPITKFFRRIDESEVIGIIFFSIWILFVTISWYWVCFMGGAQKWSDGILRFWGKFTYQPMSKPKVLKIFMTIFVIVSWCGFSAVLATLF